MEELRVAPKVSVGMPVFNGEKYLKEAIDSILSQSFTDFELIISDNASTDSTQTICKDYLVKDNRIRYIRQTENHGAGANFSYVLNNASGKYFIWAAADDFWHPQWLEKLYKGIIKDSSIATFGLVTPINELSKEIKHIAVGAEYGFLACRILRRMSFFIMDESRGKANLIYSLYPTEVLQRIEIGNYMHDYSIVYDLLSVIKYESVGNVFLYKRDHMAAASNAKFNNVNNFQRFLKIIFPIPYLLLKEYFMLSNKFERILILLCIPLKLCSAYVARINTRYMRIN